jgi:hypothetical protein
LRGGGYGFQVWGQGYAEGAVAHVHDRQERVRCRRPLRVVRRNLKGGVDRFASIA